MAQQSDAPLDSFQTARIERDPEPLCLTVLSQNRLAGRHHLPIVGVLVVGRGGRVDVQVDDPMVSRRHVKIVVHAGTRIEIEDLGGTNGTFVRGRKLSPGERQRILPGEGATIGRTVLLLSGGAREPEPALSVAPDATTPSEAFLHDDAMTEVVGLAHLAASSTLNVLITGETGAGKDVLARYVVSRSARAQKPFLTINCAALSETLLESELFGHEKGAFTGAVKTKLGLLESAEGGTVFLDEIGELPLALQAKLLRVIENHEVLRVGAVRTRQIDVRFIAATNRDLESDSGSRFRTDLYYRLNGLTLMVPPLRARPRATARLARDFAAAMAVRLDRRSPPEITPEALDLLAGHLWPGNVRELRNVIERATLVCGDGPILPEHLPPALVKQRPLVVAALATAGAFGPPGDGAQAHGEHGERQRILAALARSGGNQRRAAAELGIAERTFRRVLAALDVPRPRKGPKLEPGAGS